MSIRKIVDQIKSCLDGVSEKNMHDKMLRHYKILHLIGEDGKWTTPELQAISNELLPENITEDTSKIFIDKMAAIALKNAYLVDFFKIAEKETFTKLSKKMETEGRVIIPNVIAWAFVLERLTKAMYDNPIIIRNCVAIFQGLRNSRNLFKGTTIFYKIKLLSIERPITNNYLKNFETGIVNPSDGRWTLPLNILEATITDYLGGRIDNARAGVALLANGPGKKNDPRTGAGPSDWSPDKKVPRRSSPLPTEWADLYQTWNMAFVTHFPAFPQIIAKLFIPIVADYQDKPKEYLYIRVLALYLTLYHFGLDKIERNKNNQPEIDWYDEKLTRLWGKINLESAKKYKSEISRQKRLNAA
jgi:hypothetical protein